jgi:hypothetical protein
MNRSMRRPTVQSMRQLIRPATIGLGRKVAVLIKLYTNEAIHRRCGIG